jgi:hypothetical protein
MPTRPGDILLPFFAMRFGTQTCYLSLAVALVLTTGPACQPEGAPVVTADVTEAPDVAAPQDVDTPSDAPAPAAPDAALAPGQLPTLAPVDGDPGRVTLHRLNRAEYNNTVRDLLGTSLQPADDFPNDDHGYGFDNIADVLSMSPLLFELYEHAAELLVREAMAIPLTEPASWHFEAEEQECTNGGPSGTDKWNMWSNGEALTVVQVPATGTYTVSTWAYGQQGGPAPVKMSYTVDGVVVAMLDVTNDASTPALFEASFEMSAGLRQIGVGFTNDFYIAGGDPCTVVADCASEICKGDGTCGSVDRNLVLDWYDLYGPLELIDTAPVNTQRQAIMVCEPDVDEPEPCLRQVLAAFGRRAWRRPLTDDELDDLLSLRALAVQQGFDLDGALNLALQAMLVSPHFVFRVETDPAPEDLTPHPLGDHELASRLSYFLWSSMPDEALFAAADAGALSDPAEVAAQVARMLDDPRAHALVENFGGQWLYIRALDGVIPDPWVFPGWSESLRASMRAEAWLFFHSFVSQGRDMRELLTATDSWIDEELAVHYGIEAFFPSPDTMIEMDVRDAQRGGVLRQGALLTALSYPTRTSPVLRGKWVLTQLLCDEPPPPPPGVEGLPEAELEAGTMTLAEILAQHREDPSCAGCHQVMDPIGLGFENYNGVGQWRDTEAGTLIDPAGDLPGGVTFSGPGELIDILIDDPRLGSCMVEQLVTYALGRGLEPADEPYLEAITEAFVAADHRFDHLAALIATSGIFTSRRGEPADESAGEEE